MKNFKQHQTEFFETSPTIEAKSLIMAVVRMGSPVTMQLEYPWGTTGKCLEARILNEWLTSTEDH
jgi:hypothetical protein